MLSAHQYKTAFLFQWLRMLAQLQHAENEQGGSQLSSSFCLFVTASVVAVVLPSRKWYGICDIYTGGGKCRNAFAVPSQCSLVRSGDKALKFKATKCFSHWKKPLIVFRMIVLKETRKPIHCLNEAHGIVVDMVLLRFATCATCVSRA